MLFLRVRVGLLVAGDPMLKCLRIYSTPDGESHFDEVEIPTTARPIFGEKVPPFALSALYPASDVRFKSPLASLKGAANGHGNEREVAGSAAFAGSDGCRCGEHCALPAQANLTPRSASATHPRSAP